jgi:hypothetical protein
MSMAEKYPLTEKKVTLREPTYQRWQYTLSGWIQLIRTTSDEEGQEMERQICDRMWNDLEFNNKIRAEFEEWLAQGPDMPLPKDNSEEIEDKLRKSKRRAYRYGGKYKGRGKFRGREA